MRSRSALGRLVGYGVLLSVLTVVSSGCVAIKSQSASQPRLPGFVTLNVTICVSDHDRSTYTTCDPDTAAAWAGTPPRVTTDSTGTSAAPAEAEVLIGYRVPDGTVAPSTFPSSDGRLILTKNPGYTSRLTAQYAPPPGFHWEGYLSTEVAFNAATAGDRQTTLAPEFMLPPGEGGAPFTGLFLWRAVAGFRITGLDSGPVTPAGSAVDCTGSSFYTFCFDSPSSNVGSH